MIPRLQARGTSFKGSCTYVLHDKQAKTTDRVAWILSQNLHSDPEDAWFEMYQTCQNQDALKRNAGVSARGRKNTTPVLHYTLAWHANDQPTATEMKEAALASIKVLGLEEHEAIIVGHSDKQHPHVHIVANTVHPYTGRTAALKYSKERLSEWAEQFERQRGQIRCEERVKNNEKRREVREQRREDGLAKEFAEVVGRPAPAPKPFMVIKDNSPSRPQWLDKKVVTDRMKRLRAQLDLSHKIERGVTWERQRRERDALDKNTDAAIDNARTHMRERFRPQWREIYKAQGKEARIVARTATHPFERACFVFRNRDRLGHARRLSFREMVGLIVSGKRLTRAIKATHRRERRALAQDEKIQTKQLTERIWVIHRERFHTIRYRQNAERDAERSHQRLEAKDISFAHAKADLIKEMEAPARVYVPPAPKRERAEPTTEFNLAAWQTPEQPAQSLSREEQIRRDMAEWRRNHPNRDFGREL